MLYKVAKQVKVLRMLDAMMQVIKVWHVILYHIDFFQIMREGGVVLKTPYFHQMQVLPSIIFSWLW